MGGHSPIEHNILCNCFFFHKLLTTVNCHQGNRVAMATDQFHAELVPVVLGDLERSQTGHVLVVDKVRSTSEKKFQRLGLVVRSAQM